MTGFLQRVAADRFAGDKPSPARAAITAVVTGAAAAGLTYRLLRS